MLSYATPFSGYSFSYDARNRQMQAFVGAIPTSWLINGLGQRIGQMITQLNVSVPQFFFVYDEAGHLSGKYDGLGNPVWETVWLGDLPVAVLAPAGDFYVAPDHLGSPHQITDANGAVAWLWRPDPFGNGDPTGAFGWRPKVSFRAGIEKTIEWLANSRYIDALKTNFEAHLFERKI